LAVVSAVNPVRAEVGDDAELDQDADVEQDAEVDQAEEDEQVDYARTGLYLGVAGTLAMLQGDTGWEGDDGVFAQLEYENGIRRLDNLGLQAWLGFRATPRVAVELHFDWTESFDFTVAQATEIPDSDPLAFQVENLFDGTFETFLLDANFKVYLLTGCVQPFLGGGLGYFRVDRNDPGDQGFDGSDWDFAIRLSWGLDLYATENIVVSLDSAYVRPTSDLDDFDYFSVGWGLQYRF
jgi:opacity protein-like surface antigen